MDDIRDPLERLIRAGAATRPSRDLLDVVPIDLPISDRGTRALAEQRLERDEESPSPPPSDRLPCDSSRSGFRKVQRT